MPKKYILTILLIILFFILHQSLILKLDWRLNFWPVVLVYILFVFNEKLSLIWALGLGFLLDTYSVLPFGTNLIVLFLTLLIIYLLAKNFITNRSFLSFLILTLLATLLYNGFLFLSQELFVGLNESTRLLIFNLNTIFVQLISNLILAAILFIITFKFTNRLKVDLLERK